MSASNVASFLVLFSSVVAVSSASDIYAPSLLTRLLTRRRCGCSFDIRVLFGCSFDYGGRSKHLNPRVGASIPLCRISATFGYCWRTNGDFYGWGVVAMLMLGAHCPHLCTALLMIWRQASSLSAAGVRVHGHAPDYSSKLTSFLLVSADLVRE